MTTQTAVDSLLTAEELLKHWQGHRRVTRRTIEAFPEDQLFQFSLGGMRSFGAMACELLGMAGPMVEGLVTGEWPPFMSARPGTKEELLELWDAQTVQLDQRFPEIPAHQFRELQKAFGQWEMPGFAGIEYAIENEIHHRGEGYVYLRALGIEPPPFWQRD